ncbi:hypothetical protein [Flagellimonas sp.]|uniref:hypothetical protein n=1 Tax=Flagellimonas sp. TaxID=2058762 RepID=UPI003B527FB0
MKRLPLLFLLISTIGISQEKFIEVLVKDTIVLKPKSFEYLLKGDFVYDFGEESTKERTEKIMKSNKRVLEFIKRNSLQFEENQINLVLAAFSGIQPISYTVFVPNIIEKEIFLEKVEQTNGLDYSLIKTNYEQNESTEERIYKKLLEKADKRAERLGKIKNLKIGDLIEISETKASETVFSSFMEKLLESGDTALDVTTTFINDKGVLRKSISVKYSVE